MIDDCIFTRESWQRVLRASGCLTFGSAGELVQWLESKPSELRQLLCMIVDYYLDDDVDGLELAGIIHQHLAIPVLLSTDAYLNKNEMDLSMITAIIPKTPVPVEELRRVLAALGAADQLAV